MTQESVLNQFNDPSHKFLVKRLRETPGYVDLVKYASLDSDTTAGMSDHAFAWPERRLFPIDTEDNATLSWVYAEKNASVPDYVREEIRKALDTFDVELPQTRETKVAHTTTPTWVIPSLQRWEVKDGAGVKLAAAQLTNHTPTIDLDKRTEAAVNIHKYANQHGVSDLTNRNYINKLAGATASNLSNVREWLEARSIVAPAEYKSAYTKMAEVLEHAEEVCYSRDSLIKLASSIYDMDRKAGLCSLYGKTIPDPVLTVFNTEKLAESTVDVAGASVPMSALTSVPLEYYGDIFGEEIIPEISTEGVVDPGKLATILTTMPRDLLTVLRQQLGC